MAGKLALFFAVAVVPAIVVGASEYIVGGDEGWKVGVNYTAWAEGKEFRVGDSLVFRYDATKHDLIRVNGSAFNTCDVPANAQPETSGNDKIILSSPGRKWYICGKGNHCKSGMKLFINVIDEAEAPAPSPTGGEYNSATAAAYPYLVASLFAALAMLVMH